MHNKYITYATPEGQKFHDIQIHEVKSLKANAYRINYYQSNVHGNVVQLTDFSGNISKSYDHDALGAKMF